MTSKFQFLEPALAAAIAKAAESPCVDVRVLPTGSIVVVETVSGKVGHQYVIAFKGNATAFTHPIHAPEPRHTEVVGSTFGGSILRMDRITVGMRMVLNYDGEPLTTSPVHKIWIIRDPARAIKMVTMAEQERTRHAND